MGGGTDFLSRCFTTSEGASTRKASSGIRASAARKSGRIAKETPGVLLDVTFDQNGDLDRESFLVKVVNGKQVVSETLPPVSGK